MKTRTRIKTGLFLLVGFILVIAFQNCATVEKAPMATSPTSDSVPSLGMTTLKLSSDVLFAYGLEQLEPLSIQVIDTNMQVAKQKGFKQIIVEGHTDSVGAEDFNKQLSLQRAEVVRKYLIKRYELLPTSIEAIGSGEAKPIADNGDFQGRRQNRRVEIHITSRLK